MKITFEFNEESAENLARILHLKDGDIVKATWDSFNNGYSSFGSTYGTDRTFKFPVCVKIDNFKED